jgi:AcrR family transcriptional regulator
MIENINHLINNKTQAMKARLKNKHNDGRQTKDGRDGSTRKVLLAAARHAFARKGLTGTSIRDIASEAKLNSSLISYYFQGKDGLYRACIEEIAQNSLQMTKKVLQPAANETEFKLRLQMFLDNIFQLFLEDRDTGLILIREYDRQNSPAADIFRESFLKIHGVIEGFFKHAQSEGYVDASKDPFTLAGLLFGCFTSQMRMEHLYKKNLLNAQEKRKVEDHIVDLFTIPPKNRR